MGGNIVAGGILSAGDVSKFGVFVSLPGNPFTRSVRREAEHRGVCLSVPLLLSVPQRSNGFHIVTKQKNLA
jgi:hypothetical protein